MRAAPPARVRLALLVLAVFAPPVVAHADAPTEYGPPRMASPSSAPSSASPAAPLPPPPPAITREVSYAYQTLLSDGAAAALLAAGLLRDDDDFGINLYSAGLAVYALGAPTVHFAHGQLGNGLRSLGVRVGLPLLGMLAGSLLGPDRDACDDSSSCAGSSTGAAIGLGLGALAAAALDAGLLARERVVELPPPLLAPTLGYHRSGVTLGIAGSF